MGLNENNDYVISNYWVLDVIKLKMTIQKSCSRISLSDYSVN